MSASLAKEIVVAQHR